MLVILFDIKGIDYKALFLAGQISHTAVTFTASVYKCAKTSPQTLATKDKAPSHTPFFYQRIFDQKQHDCRPPPTLHLSVSPILDETLRPPF
jgi:hypothetical protein